MHDIMQLLCVDSRLMIVYHLIRSYTTFKYSSLSVTPSAIKAGQNVYVEVSVKNTGNWPSDEVHMPNFKSTIIL